MDVTSSTTGVVLMTSAFSSPHTSLQSSPKDIGDFGYYSAPSSPVGSATFAIFDDFGRISVNSRSGAVIPFDWEEKPGKPKTEEFEFASRGRKSPQILTADELFEEGKLRPLKPPPGLQEVLVIEHKTQGCFSPKSPIKQGRKFIRETFSPKPINFDPFAVALEEARKDERDRNVSVESTSLESKLKSLPLIKKSFRKWRLRDLTLFRSASEGRERLKHSLKRYMFLFKHEEQEQQKTTEILQNEEEKMRKKSFFSRSKFLDRLEKFHGKFH